MANPFENQKGRYRPLRLVYSGQYAKLWKMRDTREDVDVGLKVLLPSAMRDRKQRALLRHEFELGSTLDFPGLVPAYEWGKEQGCYYYTMEWFPAPSVKGLVLLGYETYAPVLPTLIPMLFEPLLSLAKAGYVHRDVKPDNYLFSPEKGIRLIDYALVQKRGGWWRRLLPKGKVTQGTATYMSPEQIRKEPLDERADLYCLGGTIVELLTGMPPFSGTSLGDLLGKHLSGVIPPILSKNKNVTEEFNQFVRSLLAPKREDRPRTVADAYAAVKRMKLFVNPPKPV